jgi:hypothetical protein
VRAHRVTDRLDVGVGADRVGDPEAVELGAHVVLGLGHHERGTPVVQLADDLLQGQPAAGARATLLPGGRCITPRG